MIPVNRITEVLHLFLKPWVRTGDCVVDCTVGNGCDSVFLASCVGPSGFLHGFDIQAEAIRRTRERLDAKGFPSDRRQLIHDTHEVMDRYIKQPVRVFMFNLGYLPGGDRSVVTQAKSTLMALGKALDHLDREGLISMVLYTGHPEGGAEAEAVRTRLRMLPSPEYSVIHWRYLNQGNEPPEIVIVQKLGT